MISNTINHGISKFQIGDKLYCFNIGMQHPLVIDFVVKGIVHNDDGMFYSADKSVWVKEDYLYNNRKEAYRALIKQAENEMNSPEHLKS